MKLREIEMLIVCLRCNHAQNKMGLKNHGGPLGGKQDHTLFLMFEGSAEEAMRFYVSLFQGSEVRGLELYGPNEAGAESSVKRADFTLAGQEVSAVGAQCI